MHVNESEWIGQRLARLSNDELFPLMDVGSSTAEFREKIQPHLQRNIYGPLQLRGGRIVHVDIKPAPGVDVVGDLCDPSFCLQLAQMGVRSALVTNILHHVVNRTGLIRGVIASIPVGGYLIVSSPFAYPVHHDPIDTKFRPTVEELVSSFPGTRFIEGSIIDSGNWRTWRKAERGGRGLARTVARLCVPLYRPQKWLELARQSPYIFRNISAVAVVLQKTRELA